MQTLYINCRAEDKKLLHETISFYTLFLFSERSSHYSLICQFATSWLTRRQWKEKFIIEMYHNFHTTIEDAPERNSHFAMMDKVKLAKAGKHKNKSALVLISRFSKLIENMKKALYFDFETLLRQEFIWNWVDLLDEETVQIINQNIVKDTVNTGNMLVSLLQEKIPENKDFLILNPYLTALFHECNIVNETNSGAEPATPYFYSMPLFRFPFRLSLTKENMILLRSGIQPVMKTISDMLVEFKTVIRKKEFAPDVKVKCKSFYKRLLPKTELMQEHLEDELNFGREIYAPENPHAISLHLGVSSINTLIDYYEKSENIEPEAAAALKKNLAKKTDLGKCDVFLFWKFESAQSK